MLDAHPPLPWDITDNIHVWVFIKHMTLPEPHIYIYDITTKYSIT